jgi:hypothetical protein
MNLDPSLEFTIDDLFGSVNDIYTQFDEGHIPLAEAEDILKRCCEAFIQSSLNAAEH